MTQVTVRRVEESWVAKAKAEAAKKGVSMNQVLVDAIRKGLEIEPERRTNGLNELRKELQHHFDEGFDVAMRECSKVNPLDWE